MFCIVKSSGNEQYICVPYQIWQLGRVAAPSVQWVFRIQKSALHESLPKTLIWTIWDNCVCSHTCILYVVHIFQFLENCIARDCAFHCRQKYFQKMACFRFSKMIYHWLATYIVLKIYLYNIMAKNESELATLWNLFYPHCTDWWTETKTVN